MREMYKYLPYKLTKRIDKTGEGRSGLEIYKRRNRRDYRVIIQYKTWIKFVNSYFKISIKDHLKLSDAQKKICKYLRVFTPEEQITYRDEWKNGNFINYNGEDNFLSNFENGYVVLITPEEYFENNSKTKNPNLHPCFILGETGFIYYSSKEEFEKYPPLDTWNEVYELNTKGNKFNSPKTWVGEYVLNIKNAVPPQISEICKTSNYHNEEKINKFFQEHYPDLADYPAQTGLGNYDYDYASPETIQNVKYQMLYLALCAKEKDGSSFFKYLKNNMNEFKNTNENYLNLVNGEFKNFEEKCRQKGLLDFEKLWEIGAWDRINNVPICPLCGKPIEPHEFFEGVAQAEGREVSDNTQRAIVLMHIDALRPGKLNHRPYNLGWGHNFCNTIQGDKDISETIEELRKIIENYERHHNNGWKGIKW